MAHVRTAIRDLLKDRVTGLQATGDRVYKNRLKPVPANQLPAISVSSGDEQITTLTQGSPRRLQRILQVSFDIIADADADGAADALDIVAEEIEAVLVPGAWSAGKIFDLAPVSSTEVFDAEGRKVSGQSRLTYEVEYHTAEGAADTVLA